MYEIQNPKYKIQNWEPKCGSTPSIQTSQHKNTKYETQKIKYKI